MRRRELPNSARRLRGQITLLRRRARAVLLGTAFLAAVAADLFYDLVTIAISYFTDASIYFPPFFLVVLAVFSIYALRATARLRFSRRLDMEHGLKDRLEASERFLRSSRIPEAMVEAQATESLAAVDFAVLRERWRFRPLLPLAAIVLFGSIQAGLNWRYPDFFNPGGFLIRQGTTLVALYQNRTPVARQLSVAQSTDESPGDLPAPAPEETSRPADEMPAGEDPAPPPPETAAAESGGLDTRETGEGGEGEETAESTPPEEADAPGGGSERHRQVSSSNEGGTVKKAPSVEVTERPSMVTERPPRSSRTGADPFVGIEGTNRYLPPIPLFKLLFDGMGRTGLVDPEAIYIVPEAYSMRYRKQIVAYFNKLQTLKGDGHGP